MAAKGPGRKWISADELMRELERDPDYQARMAEKERRRLGRVERNLQDAQPLVNSPGKALTFERPRISSIRG